MFFRFFFVVSGKVFCLFSLVWLGSCVLSEKMSEFVF